MNYIGLELKACPKSNPAATTPVGVYSAYLKSKYLKQKTPHYGKWPNLPAKKYVNMAVIEKGKQSQEAAFCNSKARVLTYGDINAVRRKNDITFSDIAKPNKYGVIPKFVLVEGAPGVGKTTFAWEACRKWAEGEILQDFNLVILIRLRDQSVRSAQCLGDLIQYPRDPKVRSEVIEEITKTGGQGVLIIFEGYDEIPASLREHDSLYRNLIQGSAEFDEGTVLVTSRPWASGPFLLPYGNSRPVEQHIEILGFTAENIEEYISSMLHDDPDLLKDMKQYLELCPHIHSMMYIPLNCAIVLEVYRNSKEENSLVPKTMTELYSSLIRILLLRYMYTLPEYQDEVVSVDLQCLPACVGKHFDSLAELAYHGIFTKNQQIIFPGKELPSAFNSLGLMQSSMELYLDVGATKSYNFLHLTIQEYMAAHYILTFSTSQRVYFINTHSSQMVVTFLAGLSPETFKEAISDSTSLFTEGNYIHLSFEAKLKPRFEIVNRITLEHPFTSYVVGYFIGNSNLHWNVTIEANLRDNIHFFACGVKSSDNKQFEAKLDLDVILVAEYRSFLNSAAITIETLKISSDILFEDKNGPQNNIIGQPLIIKHLILDSLILTNGQMNHIKSYLVFTSTLTSLMLRECYAQSAKGESILAEGLQACKSLKSLFYFPEGYSHRGYDTVSNITINKIRTLKVLHTNKRCEDFCELINILCDNPTIEELVLMEPHKFTTLDVQCCEKLSEKNQRLKTLAVALCLSYEASAICDSSTLLEMNMPRCFLDGEDISTMLRKNTSLEELTISVDRTGACAIAKQMCQNNSVKKLTILNFCIGDEFNVLAVEDIASMLKQNNTLKELKISHHNGIFIGNVDTWIQCYTILSNSLMFNKTLTSLDVSYPVYNKEVDEVIATAYAKDSRLLN